MANGSSDLIPEFQLNAILLAAPDTFTSAKLIVAHYSGLVCNVWADSSVKVTYEFSGDGVHWDSSASKTFAISTPTTDNVFVLPIWCKWTRMKVENLGILQALPSRITTYGTAQNLAG